MSRPHAGALTCDLVPRSFPRTPAATAKSSAARFLRKFVYNICTQSVATRESPAYLDDISNVKSYTQTGNASDTVGDTLWALFAQDDVPLRSNLTVNLGLRYERQPFTDSTKDFAPCVGFVWDMRGAGTSVFRAGFDIYYSPIVDNSEANYALTGPTGVFHYTANARGSRLPGKRRRCAPARIPRRCSADTQLGKRSYGASKSWYAANRNQPSSAGPIAAISGYPDFPTAVHWTRQFDWFGWGQPGPRTSCVCEVAAPVRARARG